MFWWTYKNFIGSASPELVAGGPQIERTDLAQRDLDKSASISGLCKLRAVNPVRWAINWLPRVKEAVCLKIMSSGVIGD
jgi:hypothetical protein